MKTYLRLSLTLLVILPMGTAAAGQSTAPGDLNSTLLATSGFNPTAFSARVDRMQARTSVPGLAVALIEDGRVINVQGHGVAGPDGRPVTGGTSFPIGSVSKSFTALVVLQLAAEGKLGLDDPVVRYLPGFRTRDKSLSDRITIDHLATHRSGLTTLAGNRRLVGAGNAAEGPAQAVADLSGEELFAEPGRSFQYSNANYAILSRLIEVLDERSFEKSLEMRVFQPLEMSASFVGLPPSDGLDLATGYRTWFQLARPTDSILNRRMMGAGGVVASAEDLARYVIALSTRDPRVVPASAQRLFDTGSPVGSVGYAYGWSVYKGADGDLIFHDGAVPGFNSLVAMDTATGRSAVVLTNQFGLLNGQLAQAVVHEYLELEPVEPRPSPWTQLALWSVVAAIAGVGMWLFKTGRRLFGHPVPMRPWARRLNAGAVLGLAGLVAAVPIMFPSMAKLSLASAWVFFPDLVMLLLVVCGLAALLALGRLVLVIRGR